MTVKEESVPKEVILGCAAVWTVPVRLPWTLPVKAPNNDVAVTELIPDIFVESSPIILPFAFISPVTVNELRTVAPYGVSTTFELVITELPIKLWAEHW